MNTKHLLVIGRESDAFVGLTITEHWVNDVRVDNLAAIPYTNADGMRQLGWRELDPKATIEEVLLDRGGFGVIQYLALDGDGRPIFEHTYHHAHTVQYQSQGRDDL